MRIAILQSFKCLSSGESLKTNDGNILFILDLISCIGIYSTCYYHSSSGRVGSSIASSLVPPYPSSAARARDRAQALQAYFHQPSSPLPMRAPVIPNTRRSSGHLRLSQGPSLPSSSDQTSSSFFVYPSGLSTRSYPQAENQLSSRNQGWEREIWLLFH